MKTQLIDAVIDQAIAEQQVVGAVVLASVSGRRLYERAAGLADRESRIPVRIDTIFRWASLTKPVVAVATLALVERGVISLDDPVTRFLPDFRPALASGSVPILRVRHLISHTAGLSYGFFEPGGTGPYHDARVSDGMDQPGLAIDENLKRIAAVPLARAPGEAWAYSVGTDVLGGVIARAAKMPLPALIEDLVTRPLEMRDSSFVARDRGRLATAYDNAAPVPRRMRSHHLVEFNGGQLSFVPDRMFDSNSYASGGAGMSGTAGDFQRLLEALRTGGAPILSKASIDALSTITSGSPDIMLPGWKWPLGWAVLADPGLTQTPQSRGSWLWGGVYGNSWFVDPARELTVVVQTNTAVSGMMGPFPDAIRDSVYKSIQV
jgi:CubicO group peptidase (beta-lactamase class C family)